MSVTRHNLRIADPGIDTRSAALIEIGTHPATISDLIEALVAEGLVVIGRDEKTEGNPVLITPLDILVSQEEE